MAAAKARIQKKFKALEKKNQELRKESTEIQSLVTRVQNEQKKYNDLLEVLANSEHQMQQLI